MRGGAPSRWPRFESGVSTRRLRQPRSHGVLRFLTLAESRLTVIFGQYSPSFLAMNTLAVLMVPIYGKRLKFFRRHIAPPSSLVSLLLPPRFAAEAITCAGVCQYIHRIEGAPMMGGTPAPPKMVCPSAQNHPAVKPKSHRITFCRV